MLISLPKKWKNFIVPYYDPIFVKDTKNLFERNNVGVYGAYRYSDPLYSDDPVRGAELWAKAVQSPSYYVKKSDTSALLEATSVASSIVKGPVTPIILGPGDLHNEKEFVLIDSFDRVAGCVVDDISQECAETTRVDAMNTFGFSSEAQSVAITTNFFKNNLFDDNFFETNPDFRFEGTPVMIISGQTAFNIEGEVGNVEAEFVKLLLKLRGDLLRAYQMASEHGEKPPESNPYLIISHDFTNDKKIIEAAYEGFNEFSRNVAHRIKRDAPVSENFEPLNFDAEYNYHPEHSLVTVDLVALKSLSFKISEVSFHLFKGERCTISNSFKPSIEDCWGMASEAGFRQKASICDEDRRVAVHFLELEV